MKNRTIAIVTSSRADYRYIYWVMKWLKEDESINLQVLVTGMHLSPEFGYTYKELLNDGFEIDKKIEMLVSSNRAVGMAESTGIGTTGFAKAYEQCKPDLVVVTGDRFEMLSAATAAMLMCIPLAHIGGGEITEGAVDDPIRHSITKMSQIHFCSHDRAKNIVLQMGENPSMTYSFGSPGLEDFYQIKPLLKNEFCATYGLDPHKGTMLITYHPVTLLKTSSLEVFKNILLSIKDYDGNIVFTGVNADLDGRLINEEIQKFVKRKSNAQYIINMGRQGYISMLKYADLMVGNSSSGLCEAPTFELPVVNIGDRQKGRLRGDNVIDTENSAQSIFQGIKKAQNPAFIKSLTSKKNPYYKGKVTEKIVNVLKNIELSDDLVRKGFKQLSLT